jgi:hypothetical protein
MNWNYERTLDEDEVGILSPERYDGIMKPAEGKLTFRDWRGQDSAPRPGNQTHVFRKFLPTVDEKPTPWV